MPDAASRRILGPDQVDDVANGVLALARELWVLSDRLCLMERVLASRGIDVAAEIDRLVPDEALQVELDRRRNRLMTAVVGALAGSGAT